MKRYIGVAWYPELWPEAVWKDDVRKMALAGVNLVRVGEFAWSTLEPHEGEIHADALLPAVELAIANGLDVVMCTPTATPPVWLTHNHPERMHVDLTGRQMVHGGRQQACFAQAPFGRNADRITAAVAGVYGRMPGIVAWQLDNELMGNVAECVCADCVLRWHQWLEETYGNVDRLNEAWGTGVWSQSYEAFQQVPAPLYTPAGQNPSLVTAYRRYQQQGAAMFISGQAEVVRTRSDRPITLNSSLNHFIDHPTTFEALDFSSFDHYSHSSEPCRMRLFMDVFKTLKPDRPWWIMETSPTWSGSVQGHQPMHTSGYVSVEAAQAWSMGAQTVSFWLWRQQRSGSEIDHGSVLHAWGAASPGYEEIKRTADLLAHLTPVLDKTDSVRAEVALLWSDQARAFFRTEPLEPVTAEYRDLIGRWHEVLMEAGLYADGVFPDNPLEQYRLLLTPCLPDIPKEVCERGRRLMERGGTWICGPLTGFRTNEHTVPTVHALGALGLEMEIPEMSIVPLTGSGVKGAAFEMKAELGWYASLMTGRTDDFMDTAFVAGRDVPGEDSAYCRNVDWTRLGRLVGGPVSGLPFILQRRVGAGKLVLLGAMPQGQEGLEMLVKMVRTYAASGAPEGLPPGVCAIPRERRDGWGRVWVLVNLESVPKRWMPKREMRDWHDTGLISAEKGLFFRPYEVRVVEPVFR